MFLLGLAEGLTRIIDSRAGAIFRSAHACRVGNISTILQLKMGRFGTVVGEAGIEPTTPGLEGRCSIQLSYSPVLFHCSVEWPQSALVNAASAA